MKFPLKALLGTFVLGLVGFGLYAYKYHSLAIEEWKSFNDHCNNVTPLLIKTRNTHLALGAAISGQATPSAEQFERDLTILPDQANEYLKAEKVWLEKRASLLNRWDYKLVEPEYFKAAGRYQIAMYQGYYDYYKTVENFFSESFKAKANGTKYAGVENAPQLMDKYYTDIRTNRNLYNEAIDNGIKINDWRKIFAQVPELTCPEENLTIPEYYSPSPTPQPETEENDIDEKT